MINAVHALIYTKDPAATRAFFKDVLGFPHVDAGEGWLIFALPPAELGIHPSEEEDGDSEGGDMTGRHVMYFMCDDVKKTVEELQRKGVKFAGPVADRGWGLVTELEVPGAGKVGLYQPRHAVPPRG